MRLAEATDAWLEALRKPGFWQRNESGSSRTPRGAAQPRVRSRPYRTGDDSREVRGNRGRQRTSDDSREVRGDPGRQQGTYYQSVRSRDGTTYRTMCVRLCDGYYWPVSFTATRSDFVRDSEICEQSCDSPAALHTYRNPGAEPDDMVDLKGQPYAQLSTAFSYRATYNPTCKCRPHPWEEASRQRHLGYGASARTHAAAAQKP